MSEHTQNRRHQDEDTVKKATKDLIKGVSVDLLPLLVGPTSQFLFRIGGIILRWKEKNPVVCRRREQLYEHGTKILKSAKKEITVVSTSKDEEFPFQSNETLDGETPVDKRVMDYFIALHSAAYKNLYKKANHRLKIVRYTDLNDSSKCHVAFSLLYYGCDVEIVTSTAPVEFLTNEQTALIGLASHNKLFNGIRLHSPELCDCLRSWAKNDPSRQVFRSVRELKAYQSENDHNHGDESCFFHIADELPGAGEPDANPVKRCAEEFDKLTWYADLYTDDTDYEARVHCYSTFVDLVKNNYQFPQGFRFLDIGCGTAFGATALAKKNVKYFGLDASKRMCEEAKKNASEKNITIHECDAIALLLDPQHLYSTLNLKKGQRFHVIACQGNTFDFFLGPMQKALALLLFDRYLEDGGFLLIRGDKYCKDNSPFSRTFRNQAYAKYYDPQWFGDYMKLSISSTEGGAPEAEFILHPCSQEWVGGFLQALGYDNKTEDFSGVNWFGSPGMRGHYNWVFRRPYRRNRR